MKNIGIIGYGGMASYHSDVLIKRESNFSLAGIYDIDPARVKVAQDKGINVYNTADELIFDPKIDIILVATTNEVHKEYALRAIAAGKSVYTEKPSTMCASDFEEMMSAAKAKGVLLSVHQNRRWDSDYLTVKKAYDNGLLGNVFSIESRVQSSNGMMGGWRCLKEQGGGMLFDWGVHLIDQMLMMVKEKIVNIYCRLQMLTGLEVDDGFKLLITFESGKVAVIDIGTQYYIDLPRWTVSGDIGAMQIDDWDLNGKVVKSTETSIVFEPEIVMTSAGPTKTMAPRPPQTINTTELDKVISDGSEFYKNLYLALCGEAVQEVKPEEVLRVLKVIDAAFESHASNKSIDRII